MVLEPTAKDSTVSPTKALRSPAKSILLTPGTAARRKNVNVTFHNDPNSKTAATARTLFRDTKVVEERPAATVVSESSEDGYWKTEYIKYRAQTEKEMRKLVRYRQIAKSYARKMDTDNAVLMQQMRERDEEIQLLKGRLAMIGKENEEAKPSRVVEAAKDIEKRLAKERSVDEEHKTRGFATRGQAVEVKESSDRTGKSRSSEGKKIRKPTTSEVPDKGSMTSKHEMFEKSMENLLDFEDKPETTGYAESRANPSLTSKVSPPTTPRHALGKPTRSPLTERSKLVSNSRSGSLTAKTEMPPDRLAAAQARLKKRAEERKRAQRSGKENVSEVF